MHYFGISLEFLIAKTILEKSIWNCIRKKMIKNCIKCQVKKT